MQYSNTRQVSCGRMENTCSFSQYGLNMEYVADVAGRSCKQTEVGELEEQILHLSSGCSFISESF